MFMNIMFMNIMFMNINLNNFEFLKSAYDEILDLKSNLDDKTGEKFIAYPLQKEIITTYQNIS